MDQTTLENTWLKEQCRLAKAVKLQDDYKWANLGDEKGDRDLKLIGGVDISFVKGTNKAVASLVVIEFPSLKVMYEDYVSTEMKFPYIPGFLAFREIDAIVDLFKKLIKENPKLSPDITVVDGNGILHHRSCGLASHAGVLLDIATIGVAKKLLCVDGIKRLELEAEWDKAIKSVPKGELCSLDLNGQSGKMYGYMLQSTLKTKKPVYVSPGHRVSFETAKKIVQACSRHRIPEPADLKSIAKACSQRSSRSPSPRKSRPKSSRTERKSDHTKKSYAKALTGES
ncbi:hypothetical protein AAMO2058_000542000 [Amorphochlora amoebiformis]